MFKKLLIAIGAIIAVIVVLVIVAGCDRLHEGG